MDYQHGPVADAHKLAARLEEHLGRRLAERVRELRVIVREDGIVLRGHASSYYTKQLVQHAVMKATPLPIAANEIHVSSTTRESPTQELGPKMVQE